MNFKYDDTKTAYVNWWLWIGFRFGLNDTKELLDWEVMIDFTYQEKTMELSVKEVNTFMNDLQTKEREQLNRMK